MDKNHCIIFTEEDKQKTKPRSDLRGMIHSIETFGALDGPGLRVVIFFEGCPLRCVYCHNRDMLDMKDYLYMEAKDIIKSILDYRPYFGAHGGVTLSGGDPIFQPNFLIELLKLCRKHKVHSAVDTSLFTSKKIIDYIFPHADLFMISLKHFDSDTHRCLTGVPNEMILENIRYLNDKIKKSKEARKPKLWFRFVVLPGYTDTRQNLKDLISFLHTVNFELIDLLPYHTYGVYKWKKLGIPYTLENIKPPSLAWVGKIKKMLENEGFKVLMNQ